MSNPVNEPYLLDALARGETVVLPNRRAARTLRQAFNERQRAAGLRAWDAAPVLAWTDWTRGLWSEVAVRGHELRLLLNSAQEHSLWREIVEASVAGRTLNSPDALAEMARSAWSLAHRATGRIGATATTSDARTFAGWAESFRRICASERYLGSAEVEEALRAHAGLGFLQLEDSVLLAGFEELTPSQSALVDALRAAGAQISEVTLESPKLPVPSRVSTVAPTPHDEITFAARWLRQFFADHAPGSPPRIAVLLPDPEEGRAELESIFREILAPELQPIEADNSASPWVFSAGTRLLAQPMISDALAILRLAHAPLSIERLGALLRSPFVGVSSEHLPAARFDANVLRRGPYLVPELDMDGFTRLIRQQSRLTKTPPFVPGWLKAFDDVRAARLGTSASRSYAEWSEVIRHLLTATNWPGERAPTPFDFSAASAWDATLDLLATLDFHGSRVSFANAVKTLEQLLQSARVSPVATGVPIQIMRPEEAEGTVFDAVVLLHATDEAWPEATRVNPLLGWPLQQELGLPGADASRDADRAMRQAESLLRRSSKLLVLSAATDEHGSLRPSPLLQQLNIPAVPSADLLPSVIPAPIVAEEILPDDVTLPSLPSPELRGGASVLKLQAACGFLAFAEVRLHSATVDPCELGLNALERGKLVHRALEDFWTATQSQAELRSLTPEERHRRLSHSIDAAFARLSAPTPGWGAAYIGLQRERLRRLLLRWLDVELQRGPFTVRQREERTAIPIGPLRLKVQPDRIDEVEGGVVLVDYKTGHRAHSSNWSGDRPDDPQLPLYALLTKQDELQALLFGRVRPGSEMKWQGLAANQTALPSQRRQNIADLELRKNGWKTVLSKLAQDFAAGRADVDPKNIAVNCDGCPQRLLCRIDPATFVGSAADDSESEEEIDV